MVATTRVLANMDLSWRIGPMRNAVLTNQFIRKREKESEEVMEAVRSNGAEGTGRVKDTEGDEVALEHHDRALEKSARSRKKDERWRLEAEIEPK